MSRVRRGLVGLGVLSLVTAAAVSPPAETLANWADGESGATSYSSLTVPSPASASCSTVQLFLRTGARVTWTAPVGGLPAGSQYELRITNVSVTPNVVRSVPTSATTFTLDDGLLGSGLLGGLLTGNASLRFQVLTVLSTDAVPAATVWRSNPTPTTPLVGAYAGGLLSGSFSC